MLATSERYFPLAGAQGLLGLLAMSDVLDDRLELQRLAAFPKEAADAVLLPHHQAVAPDAPGGRSDTTGSSGGRALKQLNGMARSSIGQGLEKIGAEQFLFGLAVEAGSRRH